MFDISSFIKTKDSFYQVCCSYSRRFGCCPMYNHELNGLV